MTERDIQALGAGLPSALSPLGALALNLRWSWHAPTRELFASLAPDVWASSGHNPVEVVLALESGRADSLAADASLVAKVNAAAVDLQEYIAAASWYDGPDGPGGERPAAIAYFSPEYGMTSVLPQYSGGLGILAGDHLKSASDLGVPIVAVGLLYGEGYFRQALDADGFQSETFPRIDPARLPLTLLREADGTPIDITLDFPGDRTLHAQVWRCDVGRVPLLLLDANVAANSDELRGLTDLLYGGDGEVRLRQELLLGAGGVRALRAYARVTGSVAPTVFHMNEGHAGFLGVERIRERMATGDGCEEATAAVRAGTVFTTHTPVPAGIDRFPRELVSAYIASVAPSVPVDDVLALGAETYDSGDPSTFNMAVMGLRLGGRANGVSLLHGEVSREMFAGLWPGVPVADIPIGSVTNGVHSPTWVDLRLADVERTRLGGSLEAWGKASVSGTGVSDVELWALRRDMRETLVVDARARLRASLLERGHAATDLAWTGEALDPDVLTIGFARRVPTYKRLTLMLRDPERLRALLLDPARPIQLVIAGKSHPRDEQGKRLIQDLVRFTDSHDVRHRIVFLPNYDIGMAQLMYPGCDVWLNNPLRPLEACGTSGMKAALNGALNLSILDGWWDEWHDNMNGWAIPSAEGAHDDDERDDAEANAMYNLIATSVAPMFYERNGDGVPEEWLGRVRHTLATLGPKVQATRMVRDYVGQLYVPAAVAASATHMQHQYFCPDFPS